MEENASPVVISGRSVVIEPCGGRWLLCVPKLNWYKEVTLDLVPDLLEAVRGAGPRRWESRDHVAGLLNVIRRVESGLAAGGAPREVEKSAAAPIRPSRIYVELLWRCNLRCCYCYAHREDDASQARAHPDLEQLDALAQEVAAMTPGARVILTGGEPALRPDLPEIIRRFKRHGLTTEMFSNGLLLDRFDAGDLAALDGISVSVHADQLSDPMTEQLWSNCRALRAASLNVCTHFTLTRSNLSRASDLIREALRQGFSVKPNLVDPVGGGGSVSHEVFEGRRLIELSDRLHRLATTLGDPTRLAGLYEYNTALGMECDLCGMGRYVVHVAADGAVYPCSNLMAPEFLLGRVYAGRSLRQVLDAPECREIVDAIRVPVGEIERCGECGFRSTCKGGCRAIAYVRHGSFRRTNPRCLLHRHEIIRSVLGVADDATRPGPSRDCSLASPQASREQRGPLPESATAESLAREMLQAALELAVPVYRGRAIEVGGLRRHRDGCRRVSWHDRGMRFELPGYLAAVQTIAGILEGFELLDAEGRPIEPEDVVPRRPERFRVAIRRGIDYYVNALSSQCDARCEFCYERRSPLPFLRGVAPYENVRYRLKQAVVNPETAPATPVRFFLEPSRHPRFFDLLEEARRLAPHEEIGIQTNGAFLSPENVRRLAEIGRVYLQISLNHADPQRRRRLMRIGGEDSCIAGLALLGPVGVRFAVSIVGWPSIPIAEIEETIGYADRCRASHVTVHFGSFTRYNLPDASFRRDWESYWHALRERLLRVRHEIETPVLCTPGTWITPSIDPLVEGVVRNSPAARAGLQIGDRVLAVRAERVFTKSDTLAAVEREVRRGSVELLVERGASREKLTLHTNAGTDEDLAPYKPPGYGAVPDAGLCMSGDISSDDLRRVVGILRRREPRYPLMLSSRLMAPLARTAASRFPEVERAFREYHLRIQPVENRYLGGNIMLTDLTCVEDHVAAVRRWQEAGNAVDLILLPSSTLLRFDKDIRGDSYRWIRRLLKIPVEVVPCQQIIL